VTVGGGADGFGVVSAFLRAARLAPLPCPAVVVTGPLMPAADVAAARRLAAGLDVRVFELRTDMEAVVAGARAVVAMAGYNTVSELLRARKPALLVPRVRPSREQLIRAQALADGGRAALLHPDELTPRRLRDALDALLARGEQPGELADGDGAARAAALLGGLADAAAEAAR
jgi:predicted glycosyltransferase